MSEVARLIEETHRKSAALGIGLSAVGVINRAAVQLLVKRDGRDTAVTGCPAYVREWMLSESRRGGTGR
jgi:hypothetical protein